MQPKLPVIALVIALIALLISAFNLSQGIKVSKLEKEVKTASEKMQKIEPVIPQLQVIKDALPKLNQLLISIPPK